MTAFPCRARCSSHGRWLTGVVSPRPSPWTKTTRLRGGSAGLKIHTSSAPRPRRSSTIRPAVAAWRDDPQPATDMSTNAARRRNERGMLDQTCRGARSCRPSNGERELDAEARTDAFVGRDVDRAAVRLADRLRDREAEPRPGRGVLRRAPRTEEAFEQPPPLVEWDPGARVLDLEHRGAVRPCDANRDASVGRSELDRVREQIVDELGQPRRIARQRGNLVAIRPELDMGP